MKETEELVADPFINDLDSITKEHYYKQMAIVKTILNLKKKEFTAREVAMKIQVAYSYVVMVFEKGEEEMDNYWNNMYGIKKDYKEST